MHYRGETEAQNVEVTYLRAYSSKVRSKWTDSHTGDLPTIANYLWTQRSASARLIWDPEILFAKMPMEFKHMSTNTFKNSDSVCPLFFTIRGKTAETQLIQSKSDSSEGKRWCGHCRPWDYLISIPISGTSTTLFRIINYESQRNTVCLFAL